QRPDHLIANSTHTASEIKKYYGREASVIFPPVDIKAFTPTNKTKHFGLVIAGRQTPYKRFDLAVKACAELGLHLTVIGDGPENKRLRSVAGPSIEFVGHLPREEVVATFQRSEAFLFPGLDD